MPSAALGYQTTSAAVATPTAKHGKVKPNTQNFVNRQCGLGRRSQNSLPPGSFIDTIFIRRGGVVANETVAELQFGAGEFELHFV